MEFDEKDAEVIKLLTQLKNVEGGYPVEMMALRRQTYVHQIAGLGTAGVIKEAIKSSGGSGIPPAASILLETILIVAIVAEAAAVALINREKVTDFIIRISNQPSVVEVASTSVEIPPPVTDLVVPTTVQPTVTATPVTVTPTGTPAPALLLITNVSESEEAAASQILATPKPQDNNGNQYGLTPKPERTKDSGGGDNDGGNDQKPKKDTGNK